MNKTHPNENKQALCSEFAICCKEDRHHHLHLADNARQGIGELYSGGRGDDFKFVLIRGHWSTEIEGSYTKPGILCDWPGQWICSFLIILEFKSGTRNREVVSHQCKALVILSQLGIPKSCSMGGSIDDRQVATEVMGTKDMNKCFSKKDVQQTHQKVLGIISH